MKQSSFNISSAISAFAPYRIFVKGIACIFSGTALLPTDRKQKESSESSAATSQGSKTNQRSLWLAAVLVSGLLIFSACSCDNEQPSSAAQNKPAELVSKTISVKGMTCGSCNIAIEKEVNRLNGIQEVKADHQTGSAIVKYDKNQISAQNIIEAINQIGYTAEMPPSN